MMVYPSPGQQQPRDVAALLRSRSPCNACVCALMRPGSGGLCCHVLASNPPSACKPCCCLPNVSFILFFYQTRKFPVHCNGDRNDDRLWLIYLVELIMLPNNYWSWLIPYHEFKLIVLPNNYWTWFIPFHELLRYHMLIWFDWSH